MMQILAMNISGLDPAAEHWQRRVAPARMAYIQQQAQPAAQARSLGVSLLLDYALGKYMPEVPRPPEIATGEFGRPYLAVAPMCSVNWSHADQWAVCAISSASSIGVDIERTARVRLDVARRFFAAEEIRWLDGLPAAEHQQALGELWTLKEAYTKALGRGLHESFQGFAIPMQGHQPQPLLRGGRQWRFRIYPLDPDFTLSVCVAGAEYWPAQVEQVMLAGLEAVD